MVKKISIFIFFRDFRIIDNTSLNQLANTTESKILPVFIFNPQQISDSNPYKSNNSVECLCKGLIDLNNNFKKQYGQPICLYQGETIDVLNDILKKNPIDIVAFNLDLTPFAQQRNRDIVKWCKERGIAYITKKDYQLTNPDSILTNNGGYYKRFKPFYDKVIFESQNIIEIIDKNHPNIQVHNPILTKMSYPISKLRKFYTPNPHTILPIFSRQEMLYRLDTPQLEQFRDYKEKRNYPRYDTTHFATFLKYGLVSFREVYQAVYKLFGKQDELLRQLVWKEYYSYLMYHLPEKQTIGGSNFQKKDINWENNTVYFEKWKKGITGFPFIDACMRQMNNKGWMHNRGRLCVANFLVYCLMIDWHWGEQYFAQTLIDYDISQNNGNWQWCAGVGIDRKPYLRMYNPYDLIKKYDKECIFVKQWCPELRNIPENHLRNWEKYCKKYSVHQPMINYKERRDIASKRLR